MSILCFGDYLMHFSPLENRRFMQADSMYLTFTGAEANVCAALSYWGETTQFVTKLPKHQIALKGVSFLKSLNIGTDFIEYGEGRMGVYFLENGVSLRPSSVIYDRSNSVFTNSDYDDYNFQKALEDTKIIYLSGITPALSDTLLNCCIKLLKYAKEKNISVFYDVNYRPALCGTEKAYNNLQKLMPYITHLISNEEHLKQLLGIKSQYGENETFERLKDLTIKSADITGIKNIAITVRRTLSASRAVVSASYWDSSNFALSPSYDIEIVDRVGSGDAFSAGLIYSVKNGFDTEKTVDFAIASSAMKHTIMSDINFSTVEEITALMNKKGFDVKR